MIGPFDCPPQQGDDVTGSSVYRPAAWGHRRLIAVGAIVAILAILSVVFLTRPVAANEQFGLQTINVQMGTEGSVHAMTTASVTKDANGTVTESAVVLDPTESVSQLPVRVQTSWWHDGSSGTDLSELDGKSGRFVVQVSVQDLTADATELSYETGGARYRQQALVGVPLTVVASATLTSGDRVVQVDDGDSEDARVTNGVLVETSDTGRSVQWSAYLAPPMLSPTADFTLVVDTQDFHAPDYDITVQPGLVTDPSVAALVDRAFGSDGYSARLEASTIQLVQQVNGSLIEALDFVDQVHVTLEQDVAQLGDQTYQELESSSQTVLSHLESTSTELESILASAEGGLTQVGAQTHSGVTALARSLNDILGSTSLRPELTETVINECAVTMPTLAEGQARTVASTVFLADAQLQAIAELFDSESPVANCRGALHALVLDTVGDPSALEGSAAQTVCRSTPTDERTVACTLWLARTTLTTDFTRLAVASEDVRANVDQLQVIELAGTLSGADGLAASLTELRERIETVGTDYGQVGSDLGIWARDTAALVQQARSNTEEARGHLVTLRAAVGEVRSARDSLYDVLFATDGEVGGNLTAIVDAAQGIESVGSWFLGSDYATGLTSLVDSMNAGGDVCAADWASGLQADSTADQIVAALDRLDEATCPAQGLAVATRDLVTGYAQTAETVTTMGTQAAAAQEALDGLSDGFAALDAAIADVETLTSEASSLESALAALSDGSSGTLPELANRVEEIAALSAEGGDLHDLDSALDEVVALITGIWPDDEVQPLTDTATCAPVQPDVAEHSAAAGQAVVQLSNRLLCLEAGLVQRMDQLETQIDQAAVSTDAQFALTQDRTQGALDRASEQIDLLSDSLVAGLTTQRAAATESSLAMIDASREQMRSEVDEILAAYDLASSQVLQQLSESMLRSAAQSTQVAQSLNQDFADLLANLGSPDPTSRGGMLGKLHSITTQVGETGSVLDSVGTTVTAYGNVRSGELRDIDLRAAQFVAAEDRLAEYRPFAGLDADLETVFVFQLRGEQ